MPEPSKFERWKPYQTAKEFVDIFVFLSDTKETRIQFEWKPFYTISEFANLLGFSTSTVDRLCDEGYLRFWQATLKSQRRIPVTELQRHMKNQEMVGGEK